MQTIYHILSSLSEPSFIKLYGKAVSTARSCHLRHSDPQQTILEPSLQIFIIQMLRKRKRALEASHRPLGEPITTFESCRLPAALLTLTSFAFFRFNSFSRPCFGRFTSLCFSNRAVAI